MPIISNKGSLDASNNVDGSLSSNNNVDGVISQSNETISGTLSTNNADNLQGSLSSGHDLNGSIAKLGGVDGVLSVPTSYGSAVTSVNGMTGDVVLDIPENTSDLNNDSGFITGIDLEMVESALGYTPYQKPQNGIPSSDLAEGVIPEVPEDQRFEAYMKYKERYSCL